MQFVIATNNRHKVDEIKPVFPKGITLLTLDEVNVKEEIPESSFTILSAALLPSPA